MVNWLPDMQLDAVQTAQEPLLGTYSKPVMIHRTWSWLDFGKADLRTTKYSRLFLP